LDGSEPNSFVESEIKSDRAIRNLQSSIFNWAEGRVHGPGDAKLMLALVLVLVHSRLLHLDRSPEDAAGRWFRDLERLRAGRRVAGLHVRYEIDHLLEDRLGGLALAEDGLEVELDNGMVVSLHQLAMISNQVSRVSESSLWKLI
jgi:hypothetical protein